MEPSEAGTGPGPPPDSVSGGSPWASCDVCGAAREHQPPAHLVNVEDGLTGADPHRKHHPRAVAAVKHSEGEPVSLTLF